MLTYVPTYLWMETRKFDGFMTKQSLNIFYQGPDNISCLMVAEIKYIYQPICPEMDLLVVIF